MLFNSMPNSSFCTGAKGGCISCQKKYNCLPYAISILENLGNGIQGMVTNVTEGLETLSASQNSSQQQLASFIDSRAAVIENNISKNLTDTTSELKNDIQVIKETQSYNEPVIENAVYSDEIGADTAATISNESALAKSTQKTWKEKKTIFGKKWVEE